MSHPRHAALAAILGTLWAASSDAAKPAPRIDPAPPTELRHVGAPRVAGAASTCIPGALGPAVFAVDYILPPHDVYYTYIHCDACAPDNNHVDVVHIELRFPVACVQPVAVRFVAATGDSACLEPDTTRALSSSFETQLTAPDPGDYAFDVALPATVAFSGDAFLSVDFTADGGAECSAPETRPRLLTTASCFACRSWNDSVAGRQDLCRVLLPGQPVMFARFDVCVVSVRHASWGTLKQLYR